METQWILVASIGFEERGNFMGTKKWRNGITRTTWGRKSTINEAKLQGKGIEKSWKIYNLSWIKWKYHCDFIPASSLFFKRLIRQSHNTLYRDISKDNVDNILHLFQTIPVMFTCLTKKNFPDECTITFTLRYFLISIVLLSPSYRYSKYRFARNWFYNNLSPLEEYVIYLNKI